MPRTRTCDLAIVGGGLAGGLIALALAKRRPELDVVLVEAGETVGGNHTWSFFGPDAGAAERELLAPLVCHAWPAYDVSFPGHARTIATPYYAIESDRLDAVVRAALPGDRLVTGRRALAASANAAVLDDGERIEAGGVIDCRGAANLRLLTLGWQKFVGQVLTTDAPHGIERPMVMDATVNQHDGYRFVYLLPFDTHRLLVEDTYYSEYPALQPDLVTSRIRRYAEARGWTIASVGRTESGVLPVTMGGDFEAYWQSGGNGVAKAGVRAGLFHPTTGYSLPDAARTALLVAGQDDLSGAALHQLLHAHAAARWAERGFYRMLDRMLFKAAQPTERYKVLERFYRLDAGLVGRFYAARSTLADKARVLTGRPPVPIGRAISAILRKAA